MSSMEHSIKGMEDTDDSLQAPPTIPPGATLEQAETSNGTGHDGKQKFNERKRKGNFPDSSLRFGSRGGRDGARGNNKRNKKGDMGRAEYFRDQPDKRQKTDETREKRQQGKGPNYGTQFSKEEIDSEERRPKRKVAVMIGYSGTGYKGLQISASEKTIEGDLFNAFIAAGAISKANADDPKKASLVRCARTDKGVHAAGNMLSLKLIVEDEDIVARINEHLSPQIRVWGIERTIGSFNCYQACDSRWYEYLIPSYAFLPPHPSSWLAKQLEALADDAGDRDGYEMRQEEVKGFWEKVDEEEIKPVLENIDEDIRFDVIKALRGEDEAKAVAAEAAADVEQTAKAGSSLSGLTEDVEDDMEKTEEAAIIIDKPALIREMGLDGDAASEEILDGGFVVIEPVTDSAPSSSEEIDRQQRLRAATKELRNAYTTAKRRYRIAQVRLDRIQATLSKFVGTSNFHNYTEQKTFRDASAQRHIKSFVVNQNPILIGDGPESEKSEWLSLKIHGQSFMMHQIRKMIGMVTLLVRCGSTLSTLDDSLTQNRYSIPKVPGLGLLLERPVFDSYNNIQAPKHGRDSLEFGKYETEIEAFKQREIYQRIFREEQGSNEFGKFFNHIDNFKEPWFLYVSSKGLEALRGVERKAKEEVEADEYDAED